MTRSFTAAPAAAFRLDQQHLSESAGHTGPALRRRAGSIADVCRDSGGIQAQVMSAAEMSIWTRRRGTTRAEIQDALWKTRDVVKTSAMRLTLHLIPARDFAIYIAALKPMSFATLQRWHARVGAKPDQVRAMIDPILESLRDDEPQTQQELIARVKKNARRGVRAWLDHAWSAVRPAVIDGAIVYGPPRGAEATFIRADTWLGPQPLVSVEDARAELLRRFLSAFGPASAHDFARWSGLKTSDAKSVLAAVEREVVEVALDGAHGWLLRDDVAALAASRFDANAVGCCRRSTPCCSPTRRRSIWSSRASTSACTVRRDGFHPRCCRVAASSASGSRRQRAST